MAFPLSPHISLCPVMQLIGDYIDTLYQRVHQMLRRWYSSGYRVCHRAHLEQCRTPRAVNRPQTTSGHCHDHAQTTALPVCPPILCKRPCAEIVGITGTRVTLVQHLYWEGSMLLARTCLPSIRTVRLINCPTLRWVLARLPPWPYSSRGGGQISRCVCSRNEQKLCG
jgi:hypothetical protein